MKIDQKLWVTADYPHIRIPKRMLCDQRYRSLSPEAKVVYGAMMDRTSLSYKNQDKFKNDKGETYIYYPQSAIMELLDCGHDKASKVLCELIDVNLIHVKRRGIGRPYEIVLRPVDWRLLRKKENEQSEKPLQDSGETDHSLCEKVDGNNTDINNPESNNPESNNPESNNPDYYIRNYLKNEIGYGELIRKYDPDIVDRITAVAACAICRDADHYVIKGETLPADTVRDCLLNLKQDQVIHAIKTIRKATYTTDHSDAFILSALYESRS